MPVWLGKRRLDDAGLSLLADVKIAFYHLLFGQRDVELAAQNMPMLKRSCRTVQARVSARRSDFL